MLCPDDVHCEGSERLGVVEVNDETLCALASRNFQFQKLFLKTL